MLSLTIGNNSELEIETPSGIVRLVFYKKNNGGRGVRIFTGDTKSNRWPITRTNLVRKVTKLRSPKKAKDTTEISESDKLVVPDQVNLHTNQVDHSRNGVS